MKKIALSLIALAAVSTSALARTDIDPRDRVNHSSSVPAISSTMSYAGETAAFAAGADVDAAPLTAFERVTQQSLQNESSSNNN